MVGNISVSESSYTYNINKDGLTMANADPYLVAVQNRLTDSSSAKEVRAMEKDMV